MTWNYRIIKYELGGYGLHEVYYKPNGAVTAYSSNPATFAGETKREVHESLFLAVKDAVSRPILSQKLLDRKSNKKK